MMKTMTGCGIPKLTPDVYTFLMKVTEPKILDHTACHADMIRNVVLEDIRRRIHAVYNQGCY